MNRIALGAFWITVYLVVVLSPLIVLMVPPTPPARSFWVEASLALGFVGLIQIAVQFVLIARYRKITEPYGIDLILKYHRQIAIVAIAFVVAHPIILVAHNPSLAPLLDPFGGSWASRTGNWAVYALVALAALSVFRKQIGLGYELWRVSHALLGIAALVLAHVHVYLAGAYTQVPWKQTGLIVTSVVLVGFFAYLRLVRPALQSRRPYRVAEIIAERGKTWTLAIQADAHEGMAFRPGQFAWLKLGSTPYTVEEHPFSFSSSAERNDRLEFGIKELGDFTKSISTVPIGAKVFLDGPHGSFSPDVAPAAGYVFLAGGVGIAPFMSMLRTMADRGDPRPVLLIYGNRSLETLAFHDALERLESGLDLTVVPVLEKPPSDWKGESGFIDEDVLRRHLPSEGIQRLHLICGPGPMIDAVESALDELGVPRERMLAERFDLV